MPRINLYAYKETDVYKFSNVNPKGKNASDCVVRAICAALDQDYADTTREMVEFALKIGYAHNEDKCIKKYLESKGWTTFKEPRTAANKKMSLREFLHRNPNLTAVVKVGSHHVSFVKNGICYDTWDCTKNTIHTYWRKA